VIPEAVAAWLRGAIGSLWALETLLVLQRDSGRAWTEAELDTSKNPLARGAVC
jgi:hypothetical protein